MKTLEIVGENYSGKWNESRVACRGVVVENGAILLAYETRTGIWNLPGGGLEENESASGCCAREVAEETGYLIVPSPCALELDEYYGNAKYVNYYFLCDVTGKGEQRLTPNEARCGLEPRWIDVGEALAIFSRYAGYAGKDEIHRGIYQREYVALKELLGGERETQT